MRRRFLVKLKINGRWFKEILIDPHFEKKHSKSINDEIILKLVQKLHGEIFRPESVSPEGFEYFVNDPLYLESLPYRLVWLTHPKESYIGIVNCFRRPHGKAPISK